jgi:hypothetical protein
MRVHLREPGLGPVTQLHRDAEKPEDVQKQPAYNLKRPEADIWRAGYKRVF